MALGLHTVAQKMPLCKPVFGPVLEGTHRIPAHPPSTIETSPLLARGWANRVLNPFYGRFGAQNRERQGGERLVFRLKLEEMTLKPKI